MFANRLYVIGQQVCHVLRPGKVRLGLVGFSLRQRLIHLDRTGYHQIVRDGRGEFSLPMMIGAFG